MATDEERIIHQIFDRWNAGDRTADPTLIHPEVELHSALTNSVWRGLVGVQAWIDEIADQFRSWTLRLEEVQQVAPDHWLGLGSIDAEGKESGLSLDQTAGWIFRFRDGKVDYLQTFISHAEARAVAGSLAGSKE